MVIFRIFLLQQIHANPDKTKRKRIQKRIRIRENPRCRVFYANSKRKQLHHRQGRNKRRNLRRIFLDKFIQKRQYRCTASNSNGIQNIQIATENLKQKGIYLIRKRRVQIQNVTIQNVSVQHRLGDYRLSETI